MAVTSEGGIETDPEIDAAEAGRRNLLVAGLAGAAGLGMIAAGWALARWPAAVIGSLDRIFQSAGGAPDSLGAAAGQSDGAAGGAAGGTRP